MASGSKVFLACLIATLLTSIASGEEPKQKGSRIIGGQLTTIDKVPYLVELFVDTSFMCGGSLVTRSHVVTAAHCVAALADAKRLVVVAGSSYSKISGETRGVAKIFVHPSYNKRATVSEDVAVLKLQMPFPEGRTIQTIPLCNKQMKHANILQVSGWGYTEDRNLADQVRTVRVPIMSYEQCVNTFAPGVIVDSMMCSQVSSTMDSCNGDSGGPAVYAGQLCGIVSWGYDCANPNYPGVYTDVMSPIVKNFIMECLRK